MHLDLPADARERVTVALFMIDTLERQIHEIERGLRRVARHQAGCQALMTQFGVGELIALTFLAELWDASRMTSSRKAVRFAGRDVMKGRGRGNSDATGPSAGRKSALRPEPQGFRPRGVRPRGRTIREEDRPCLTLCGGSASTCTAGARR